MLKSLIVRGCKNTLMLEKFTQVLKYFVYVKDKIHSMVNFNVMFIIIIVRRQAWLAQSVEHETLNLRVVGSSPTLGDPLLHFLIILFYNLCWFC